MDCLLKYWRVDEWVYSYMNRFIYELIYHSFSLCLLIINHQNIYIHSNRHIETFKPIIPPLFVKQTRQRQYKPHSLFFLRLSSAQTQPTPERNHHRQHRNGSQNRVLRLSITIHTQILPRTNWPDADSAIPEGWEVCPERWTDHAHERLPRPCRKRTRTSHDPFPDSRTDEEWQSRSSRTFLHYQSPLTAKTYAGSSSISIGNSTSISKPSSGHWSVIVTLYTSLTVNISTESYSSPIFSIRYIIVNSWLQPM